MKQLSYKAKVVLMGSLLLCAPLLSFAQACCRIERTLLAGGFILCQSFCDNPEGNDAWIDYPGREFYL